MNENNGLTASDVALLTGNGNNGWGDNGGWGSMLWIFALLVLANGFGGFGGGFGGGAGAMYNMFGYHPQYATQDFVQNGFNFNDLQDQNRDLMAAITSGAAQAVAATNQAKYDNINVAKDIQAALTSQISEARMGIQSLSAAQQQCCCQIQAAIAENNYNNAMNTAAINANTTAQTQRILDAITGNQIQDLRDQVGQLQLANQLQGVVRYPNGWTYNAGTNPFCGGNNCGCNM